MSYTRDSDNYVIENGDIGLDGSEELAKSIVKRWAEFALGGSLDGKNLKFRSATSYQKYKDGLSYRRGHDSQGFYVEIRSVSGVNDLVDHGRKEYNMLDYMLTSGGSRIIPLKDADGHKKNVIMRKNPDNSDAWKVPAFPAYSATKHFADLAVESIKANRG